MLLPKQCVSFRGLVKQGFTPGEITSMNASLKLFPTPFKGIYYVPLEEERRGAFIEKPFNALSQAIALYLGTKEFYYSCKTAEEALGLSWQASGEVHVVNAKASKKVDLGERMGRRKGRVTWRAKKIAKILAFYGTRIIFHKSAFMAKARTRETPYGRFALKPQIARDWKRFHRRKAK